MTEQTTVDSDAPLCDMASPPDASRQQHSGQPIIIPSDTTAPVIVNSSTKQHSHGSSSRRSPRLLEAEAKLRASSPTTPPSASSSKFSSNPSSKPSPESSESTASTTSTSTPPSSTSATPLTRNPARKLFPNAPSRSKHPALAPTEPIFADPKPNANPVPPQTKPRQRRTKSAPSSAKLHAATRPDPGPRATTDPTPSPTPVRRFKTLQDIDCDVESQIKEPRHLSKKEPFGYVYVISRVHNSTPIIKIGHTVGPCVEKRIKVIGATCQSITPQPTSTSDSQEHRQVWLYYEQVEQLAHSELDNFRYEFVCSCKTKHKEYFTVNEEVGRMVVERWARFCEDLQPYGKEDKFSLSEEWRFHLDRFKGRNHGREKEGGGRSREKPDDHVDRGKRWESFFASTREPWFMHRAAVVWKNGVCKNGWQLWNLVLAGILAASNFGCLTCFLLGATGAFILREKDARVCVFEVACLPWDVVVHYMRSTSFSPLGKLVSLAVKVRHREGKEIVASEERIMWEDPKECADSDVSIQEGEDRDGSEEGKDRTEKEEGKDRIENGEEEYEHMDDELQEKVEEQVDTEDEELGEEQGENDESETEEATQEEIICGSSASVRS